MAGREKEVVTVVDFFVDADSVGGGKNEGHREKLQLLRFRGEIWQDLLDLRCWSFFDFFCTMV